MSVADFRLLACCLALVCRSHAATAQDTSRVSYADSPYASAFSQLYNQLGSMYPCFDLKEIDWAQAWDELEPALIHTQDDEAFGLLCARLIARLEDSHATLLPGTASTPRLPLPEWDPGFTCLLDSKGQQVVYHVTGGSPASDAGVRPGFVLTHINDTPVEDVFREKMTLITDYIGYSSDRCARYDVARRIASELDEGSIGQYRFTHPDGMTATYELGATVGSRYLPRLPVPIKDINDSTSVGWTRLSDDIGYIYVRRIRSELETQLDAALRDMHGISELIIDVRGNSGGGFDRRTAFLNFDLDVDPNATGRPHFSGPINILIDARCISAGEGWLSWFVATRRATLIGQTTAGASARKQELDIAGGLYRCRIPVKPYSGHLDRWIERRGIEPDIEIHYASADLARGRDTVLQAAISLFLEDDN